MPTYFQGRGSDLGNVHQSQATSFTEVVNMHLMQPIPLPLAKARFDMMEAEERDKAKKVAYLIAATYPTTPHERRYSHEVRPCNLIFLDIDPVKVKDPTTHKLAYTGVCPAAPFVADPDLLVRQLHPYNFAAYLTASHTAALPRMRVVVDADQIPPDRYAEAVSTVAKLLGLPVVTSESKVTVQAMYLPVMFSDQGEDDHPLLTWVLPSDGKGTMAFTVADIIEGAGTSFGKDYALANTLPHNPSALDFLRPPVDEVTIDVARQALGKIDPDIDRAGWHRIAAALKHQYSPHEEEAAYDLFDDWSRGALGDSPLFSTPTKYAGTEDTRAMWDSIRPSPDGRVPCTIRTLLHKAVEGGWSSTLIKDAVFSKVIEWIQKHALSFSQLTEQGVRRIAVAPLMTQTEEDALIKAIKTQAKEKFDTEVSITAIRKQLAQAKKALNEEDEVHKKAKTPAWAKSFIFVSKANEFFRQRTGERLSMESMDNTYGRFMPLTEDFRPAVQPRFYLLNDLKCEQAYEYEYNPSEPESIITKDKKGRVYVNTYTRSYPDPNKSQAAAAGSIFQLHLRTLIAEPEYRALLCDWLAYLVQFPGRKIRWAPLIQGVDGAGKTFFADAMRVVLGSEHVKTVDTNAIKMSWNEWSAAAQLVVAEEIRVVGTNRHEIMGVLKPLITNASVNVNQRNKDAREVINRSNYLMFTNFHDALALTAGDRRYFVIKSVLQTKAQVLALGDNYFNKDFAGEYNRELNMWTTPCGLYYMLDNLGAGLRSYFENWIFTKDFNPNGHAPTTIYLGQLIEDSASETVAAVRRILTDGESAMIQPDLVSARTLADMLALDEGMRDVSPQKIGHILRDEGYRKVGRPMLPGGVRHPLWARNDSGYNEDSAAAEMRERMNGTAPPQEL